MDTALPQKFPFILDRNLAKANCTGNRVCTACDVVVLARNFNKFYFEKYVSSNYGLMVAVLLFSYLKDCFEGIFSIILNDAIEIQTQNMLFPMIAASMSR